MLVVDDEPDNLDLLYRTFRRDFNVLRAESGQEALEILSSQGEVAVIISDQRMPEMKGTEFLSKTVPEFPDTVRIILTGFTDVEDLVDAINAGQVYRYITKPWDPDELKHVVDQAASTYDLLKQRGEAIKLSKDQHHLVVTMAEIAQTASDVKTALPAIAEVIHNTLAQCKGCVVQLVTDGTLDVHQATAGAADADLLKDDALVSTAIADQTFQLCHETSAAGTAGKAACDTPGLGAHCVAPVMFRGALVAILSVQWEKPQQVSKTSQEIVQLAAKQIGLTLACL